MRERGQDRPHGGPDAHGAARWDFSTNANACGPCPAALAAVRNADATRYPDPQYRALCRKLGEWHGVDPGRIVPAASASEFIMRITAVGARLAPGPVAVPAHAYGDYAAAAAAHARPVLLDPWQATLVWCCDPSSPWGQAVPMQGTGAPAVQVLDRAYDPLRLEGASPWTRAQLDGVFQLHSPNKALGLTGVRGAYAIAPCRADVGVNVWVDALHAAAPSWPLGAHAVAMLAAWPEAAVQTWLAHSRETLRGWKRDQQALFTRLGGEVAPSVANFFCVRWPTVPAFAAFAAWRAQGIALRDATSFGLPGWVRASVQPPEAQQALWKALHAPATASAKLP